MSDIPPGFYTALGTPLDTEGNVLLEAFRQQLEQQLDAHVSGTLILGSMGIQCSVRDEEGPKLARCAVETVRGKIPLFYGVMDNSIVRVRERIAAVEGLSLAGVVLTAPYYFVSDPEMLKRFFTTIADHSPFPVYLYDLPSVTQMKLTPDLVWEVARHPNIHGIKTGDMVLARLLKLATGLKKNFRVFFSNVDTMDIASAFGIDRTLDGMFACTPKNARLAFSHFASGKIAEGSQFLQNILNLRDMFVKYGIFPSFTAAMNLLGLPGNYAPDYFGTISEDAKADIRHLMREIGEL